MSKLKLNPWQILLSVFLVLILLIGSFCYVMSVSSSIQRQAVSDILEVTEQGAHAFEVYLYKDKEILSTLASNLSLYNSDDSEAINSKLLMFGEVDANYVVVDLENGVSYSNRSTIDKVMTKEQLTEYRALKKKASSETSMREPYVSIYTGDTMLGYYKYFTFKNGVEGLVQKGQVIDNISEEFSLSFYDNSGYSYIVNNKGDILIHSADSCTCKNLDNIFEIIESEGNEEDRVRAFKLEMEADRQGTASFIMDNEERIYAYVPIAATDGWFLISTVPSNVITQYSNNILRTSQVFVFIIAIVFFALLVFALIIIQNHKNVMEKEQEIRYREQLFGMLANNTDDVFLMFSVADYKVEYISPNVVRVIGLESETVKKYIENLRFREDSEQVKTLMSIGQGEYVVQEREREHKKTGEHRWFAETIYRTSIDNSERFIAIIADRTAERQSKQVLEEALENSKAANSAKSAFLSNMSHDIRTPMHTIIGINTLLARDADNPEKVREYTGKIASASQHLLGLVNDVLDMSKMESGKTSLNITEVSLPEIIDEIASIIRPQTKAKEQQFDISVTNITNEQLLGDKLRLNQILINILSNAVKYTPVGGKIELSISQLPQDKKHYAHLRFMIKDNGVGMSQEYLKIIFDPFTREISSLTNKVMGTGLGMPITKNIVDLMGGVIKVESELGKGSTFTVDLELRIHNRDVDKDFWKRYGVAHILVVDDEEDICKGIVSAMADTGVKVRYALDGFKAVEMTEQECKNGLGFDLVLLDWVMPVMDGIETARRIRALLPENVPIMILTAYDWTDIEEEAVAAGINGFLPKPFFLSSFRQTIESLHSHDNDRNGEIAVADGSCIEEESPLEGKHFLSAEDNELNAEILVELLAMKGAECTVAKNGKEALEMFEASKKGEYDAILMDVQMPVMNGYQAARAIRMCSHAEAKTIPIIAMTANAFADDVQEALNAGMNAHISKPVDMVQLETIINDVFTNKR